MNHQAEESLCVRCARGARCRIPLESAMPVLSCEKYEDMQVIREDRNSVPCMPEPGRMEGLCVDCENRYSCVFRTQEGGTWHCEEYR